MSAEALATKEKIVKEEEDFLNQDKSYFPVQLDPSVKTIFDHKFLQLQNNLNEYLFIEVYAFVLDKLRDYFTFFKGS